MARPRRQSDRPTQRSRGSTRSRGGLRFSARVSVGIAAAIAVAVVLAAQVSRWGSPTSESSELPGIDLSALSPPQQQALVSRAASERCPCTCGFTLYDCRHKDLTCPRSGPILDGWVREYRDQQRTAAAQ